MPGEKERFWEIEPVHMLQLLGTSVQILGKLQAILETQKRSTWGDGVRKRKLYEPTFYKCKYFVHLASFTLVWCDKVFESKESKWTEDNWNIWGEWPSGLRR